MQTAQTLHTASPAPATDKSLTLDSLSALSFAALEALYLTAPCTNSMRSVDGTPKGRMLAVKTIGASPLGSAVRRFAASSAFVWDGKTFSAVSDDEGTGINRVQIPGALGRQNLFPFNTHFGESAIDGKRALVLDYDLEENPFWIRKIHDEVREITPGLFFGPAMWKGDEGPKTLLWFALETRGR